MHFDFENRVSTTGVAQFANFMLREPKFAKSQRLDGLDKMSAVIINQTRMNFERALRLRKSSLKYDFLLPAGCKCCRPSRASALTDQLNGYDLYDLEFHIKNLQKDLTGKFPHPYMSCHGITCYNVSVKESKGKYYRIL